MSEDPKEKQFERLVQTLDPLSRLLGAWVLKGGLSAQVTALEIERPNGEKQKMIVRQHGEVDLNHNPHIAADEFKLLRLLQAYGLAAPKPYYVDESGEVFATPYVVIEYIEGQVEFAPADLGGFVFRLATHLSRIHHVNGSNLDELSFLPKQEHVYATRLKTRPAKIDDSLDEGHIRDTLEAVWPLPERNKSALLHGDFWPGNILWKDGQLAAVIDWEDAQLGDPLADFANSRLEILWAFGLDAMSSFTHHYQSITRLDFANLPYWDLCAALRPASRIGEWAPMYRLFGRHDLTEQTMRDRHRLFITQAFDQLSRP